MLCAGSTERTHINLFLRIFVKSYNASSLPIDVPEEHAEDWYSSKVPEFTAQKTSTFASNRNSRTQVISSKIETLDRTLEHLLVLEGISNCLHMSYIPRFGIHAAFNTRCSILTAANLVYGRVSSSLLSILHFSCLFLVLSIQNHNGNHRPSNVGFTFLTCWGLDEII